MLDAQTIYALAALVSAATPLARAGIALLERSRRPEAPSRRPKARRMASNTKTLADRARWFGEHVNDPNAKATFRFAYGHGVSRPSDPDDLDRHLDAGQAGELGALQDAYDAGIR